jgi:hypothetical protein
LNYTRNERGRERKRMRGGKEREREPREERGRERGESYSKYINVLYQFY